MLLTGALAFFISANEYGRETNCSNNLASCEASATAAYVREFGDNKNKFIEAFIDSFTKMIEKVLY